VSASITNPLGAVGGTLWVGATAVAFRVGTLRVSLQSAEDATKSNFVSARDGAPRSNVVVVEGRGDAALVAEAAIGSGWRTELRVRIRKASGSEVERHEATQSLLKAYAGTNYTTLLAQMKRGRQRGVEAALLSSAAAKLKTLKPKCPPVDELRAKLAVKNCTVPAEGSEDLGAECDNEDCPMVGLRPGELFEINVDACDAAFEHARRQLSLPAETKADRWFFKMFAAAAVRAVVEGGVWKAYGKFNLSAPSRNQSPVELRNFLERIEQHDCAVALDALQGYVERHYRKKVAAVQINVHMDGSSSHVNHRDVYGADQKERVGKNCTCSFTTAAATACFSFGSSRRGSFRAEADKHSSRKRCCAECKGSWSKPWLHSGVLVFFNGPWNEDHTHGIPAHDTEADGECGPRISVAFLCAEGAPPASALESAVCMLLPKKAAKKAPKEASTEKEASKEASTGATKGAPKGAPEEASKEVPKEASEEAPKEVPKQGSEEGSKERSKDSS